mmetsp:Transcript_6268/g.22035  ORF Transcript_6268/g.22035 Transcript_6268/m.22035 type:complete len:123 (+) Transcript_6268:3-371(+)
MILVPSMFEPCGLTQLVAMRYGTVPVVRRTGGLNDTVFDVHDGRERAESLGLAPNGFQFEGSAEGDLDYALDRALDFWYNDREGFGRLVRTAMSQDWGWDEPAEQYVEAYFSAVKSAVGRQG